MKVVTGFLAALAVVLVAGLGVVLGGLYDVAATEPHWNVTHQLIVSARDRSIARQVKELAVPRLDEAGLISAGANHYDAMCRDCHLAPGMKDTELRAGLYPQPPSFIGEDSALDPARSFWVIKNGIKMTGMPAWGTTHDDPSIWGMVAFLQKLPAMSSAEYTTLVASGAGHSHHGEDVMPASEARGETAKPQVPSHAHSHDGGKPHAH